MEWGSGLGDRESMWMRVGPGTVDVARVSSGRPGVRASEKAVLVGLLVAPAWLAVGALGVLGLGPSQAAR